MSFLRVLSFSLVRPQTSAGWPWHSSQCSRVRPSDGCHRPGRDGNEFSWDRTFSTSWRLRLCSYTRSLLAYYPTIIILRLKNRTHTISMTQLHRFTKFSNHFWYTEIHSQLAFCFWIANHSLEIQWYLSQPLTSDLGVTLSEPVLYPKQIEVGSSNLASS